MKKRLFVLLPVMVLTVMLVGSIPATAAPAAEIRITAADHGGRVELRGQALAIDLESNPSTGYGWHIQAMDPAVLRQAGEDWVSSNPRLFGAPGTTTLRFAGVARGQTELTLVYSRAWERSTAPAQTFTIQVQVAEPTSSANLPSAPAKLAAAAGRSTVTTLPTSWDWCSLGKCTPVRDQGACGSCWSFGTVGPLESAILINDGVSHDLAEQYLVSCNTDGWGCSGGWWAHDYHEWKIPPSETAAGAVWEADFPYVAEDAACNGPYTHHEQIADWVYVGASNSVPTVDAIKNAIYTYGPVAAAVCVNSTFQAYTGGIYAPTKPCSQLNHAIVLVGWDDANQYWILRNSWGDSWGEDGYMRIRWNANQVGYGANYVVYGGGTQPPEPTPTPEPTPVPGDKMHVGNIEMWYVRSGNYYVYTRVTIVDQNNVAVPNATVSVKMTLPSGTMTTGTGTTGTDGTVTFSLKTKYTGTYASQVTNVTHATYTYDPAANVITTRSLVVP